MFPIKGNITATNNISKKVFKIVDGLWVLKHDCHLVLAKNSFDNEMNSDDIDEVTSEGNNSSEQINKMKVATRQRRANKSVEANEYMNGSKNSNNIDNSAVLNDYLEDFFDVIYSCQDGNRYISNIFHLLLSAKVI